MRYILSINKELKSWDIIDQRLKEVIATFYNFDMAEEYISILENIDVYLELAEITDGKIFNDQLTN